MNAGSASSLTIKFKLDLKVGAVRQVRLPTLRNTFQVIEGLDSPGELLLYSSSPKTQAGLSSQSAW